MGLLKDGTQRRTTKLDEDNDDLDDVDEYGYSVAFITGKYASLAGQTGGHVALIHVRKKREEELGVKIAGNKNPKVNAAFVLDIAKKSPAEKTKQLKVGDQLLEINGKTLYGRTLLQVTNLVKTHQQNEKVSLVTLRRKDAHTQMASEAESKAQMEKEASAVANFNDMLSAPTTKGAAAPVVAKPSQPAAAAAAAGPSTSKVSPVAQSQSQPDVQPQAKAVAPASSPDVITVMEVQKATPRSSQVDEPTQPAVNFPPRQRRPALPPGTIKACVLQKENDVDLGFAFYGKPQADDPSKTDIFITKIVPGTVAWLEGSLESGDQILGINQKILIALANADVDEARAILAKAEGDVEVLYRKKPHLLKNKTLPTNYLTMIEHARQDVAGAKPDGVAATRDTADPTSHARRLPVKPIPHLEHNARKNDVRTNEETWIMLDKGNGPANQHVGLSIVGGSQTELKFIVINGIVADSPAEKDGRLRPGDIVLQVDEWDVRNATHQEAVNKLNETKRQLYLLVRRDRHGVCESRLNDVFTVDLVKRPGHGLGICIGPRQGGGVYVTRLIADSIAVSDGRLAVDDVLLEMNGTDLRDMPHLDVALLLKMSMGLVVLTVARNRWSRVCNVSAVIEQPHSPAAADAPRASSRDAFKTMHSPESVDCDVSHAQPYTMRSFFAEQLDRARRQRIAYRRYCSRSRSASPAGTITSTSSAGSGEVVSSPTQALHSIVHWFTREHDYIVENQYEVFDVCLRRDAHGELGIRILNGEHLDQSLMRVRGAQYPFAVTSLAANEAANARQSNQIKVGDRVVSVNEQLVACMTRSEVLALLHGEPESTVRVRFERPADNAVVAKVPRLQIEAPPELSVKKTTVHRGTATLGLSLVGGLDEKSGQFVPFQVKSLLEGSSALKAGVKPGDCVLAVNDVALDGLVHESAVPLLKRAQGQALLTLLTF